MNSPINTIVVGLKEVWSHKFRSLLTMLGIILGVASLVGMSAIIKGMENGMREPMIAMGGADKVVRRGRGRAGRAGAPRGPSPGKDHERCHRVAQQRPIATAHFAANGYLWDYGHARGKVGHAHRNGRRLARDHRHEPAHPRARGFFTDLDEELANAVCVIGTGIRDDLFGTPEETGREIIPVGEIIKLNGQPFTIVGMFTRYEPETEKKKRELAKTQPKSGPVGSHPPPGLGSRELGILSEELRPLHAAEHRLDALPRRGRHQRGARQSAYGPQRQSHLVGHLEPALQQARNVLMLTHRGIQDFGFRTQENQLESINQQIRNARISGGIIAAISLIVGGIGIMNIMLASINERIREIGICKAVGATGLAVFTQVLIESVVIALLGAALGVLASLGFVRLLEQISPTANAPVVSNTQRSK